MHYGDAVAKRLQVWWDDPAAGCRYHVRCGGDMNSDGVADVPTVTVTCVAPMPLGSEQTTSEPQVPRLSIPSTMPATRPIRADAP